VVTEVSKKFALDLLGIVKSEGRATYTVELVSTDNDEIKHVCTIVGPVADNSKNSWGLKALPAGSPRTGEMLFVKNQIWYVEAVMHVFESDGFKHILLCKALGPQIDLKVRQYTEPSDVIDRMVEKSKGEKAFASNADDMKI
jgi:hypothetical protein